MKSKPYQKDLPKFNVSLNVPSYSTEERYVFFGKSVGTECQNCGAYNETDRGFKYCAHTSCPIALREFRRRKRKRTSSFEMQYLPAFRKQLEFIDKSE